MAKTSGEHSESPSEMSEKVEYQDRKFKNVTEIAQLLSEKLSHDEMYDVVLAIEDEDFHQAVITQWKKMEHPKPGE